MQNFEQCGLSPKMLSLIARVSSTSIWKTRHQKGITLDKRIKSTFRYPLPECRSILSQHVKRNHPIDPSKKIQTFYSWQGKVGKTSLCYQISTQLALCGYNVLVVDADHQATLSAFLGFSPEEQFPTLYDGILKSLPLHQIIRPVFPGLDCIPSNLSLALIENELVDLPMGKKVDVIEQYMRNLKKKYDFILIDLGPGITLTNRNILFMTDVLYVVCEPHIDRLKHLNLLFEDANIFFEEEGKPAPKITAIPNKVKLKSMKYIEGRCALKNFYNEYYVDGLLIRNLKDLPKSEKERMPISFFCKNDSSSFEDISDLMRFILNSSKVAKGKNGTS